MLCLQIKKITFRCPTAIVFKTMGHTPHLRNQFKSMITFERSYYYIHYKTGPVVQEENIFKFRESTFAILLLYPNVKRCDISI